MNIASLKDLEKLVKLMRKTGIDKIEVNGIKLELSHLPQHTSRKPRATPEDHVFTPGGIDESVRIPMPDRIDMPDELTEDQLMYYSAEGGNNLGPGETL